MDSMKIMGCLARTMETDVDTLLQMPPTSDLSKAGLESIKFIQFIVLLEEEMGITVRDSDLLVSNFNTREKLFATLSKYEEQNTALKKCLVVDCDNVLWWSRSESKRSSCGSKTCWWTCMSGGCCYACAAKMTAISFSKFGRHIPICR